jgi:hypothetical protein
MSEAEEDDEDEEEEPPRIIKYGDEGHDSNSDEKNSSAPPSKEGIGNMASVQLANRKKIEGGDKESNPSGITDRMEKNIKIFRNLTHDQTLNEREKEGISKAERSLFKMRCRNRLGEG